MFRELLAAATYLAAVIAILGGLLYGGKLLLVSPEGGAAHAQAPHPLKAAKGRTSPVPIEKPAPAIVQFKPLPGVAAMAKKKALSEMGSGKKSAHAARPSHRSSPHKISPEARDSMAYAPQPNFAIGAPQ